MIRIVSATENTVFESRHKNVALRALRKQACLRNLAFQEIVVGILGMVRMVSTTIIGFSRVATSCILENKQAFLQALAFHEIVGVIGMMNTTENRVLERACSFQSTGKTRLSTTKRRRLESDHEDVAFKTGGTLEMIRVVSATGNRVFESRHKNVASRTLRKQAFLQNLAFREIAKIQTFGEWPQECTLENSVKTRFLHDVVLWRIREVKMARTAQNESFHRLAAPAMTQRYVC